MTGSNCPKQVLFIHVFFPCLRPSQAARSSLVGPERQSGQEACRPGSTRLPADSSPTAFHRDKAAFREGEKAPGPMHPLARATVAFLDSAMRLGDLRYRYCLRRHRDRRCTQPPGEFGRCCSRRQSRAPPRTASAPGSRRCAGLPERA